MTKKPAGLILLPRRQIINANAISGPLTWGFPPPTAFTGFMHALQRHLGAQRLPTEDLGLGKDASLDGIGIICHQFWPQIDKSGYRYHFSLSKNPVESKKKIESDGRLKGASFVEEGRARLEVSLIIGVHLGGDGDSYLDKEDGKILARRVGDLASSMRLAGGSFIPMPESKKHRPVYKELSGDTEKDSKVFRSIRRRLLPGFALIHRHDLLIDHLIEMRETNPETNILDALLDLCSLKSEPSASSTDSSEDVVWQRSRVKPGWLVPLPVGYGAISRVYPAGTVKNARDNESPMRFVESIYSLGEWISPHRIDQANDLLWYHKASPDEGLYICDHQTSFHTTINQGD